MADFGTTSSSSSDWELESDSDLRFPSLHSNPNKKGANVHFPRTHSLVSYPPQTPTPQPTEEAAFMAALYNIPDLNTLPLNIFKDLASKLPYPHSQILLNVGLSFTIRIQDGGAPSLVPHRKIDPNTMMTHNETTSLTNLLTNHKHATLHQRKAFHRQFSARKTLLKVLDLHIEDLLICSSCTTIHHPQVVNYDTAKPWKACKASEVLLCSLPQVFSTGSRDPVDVLQVSKQKIKQVFNKPLSFAVLHQAMKDFSQGRDEDVKSFTRKYRTDLERERDVRRYWWGTGAVCRRFEIVVCPPSSQNHHVEQQGDGMEQAETRARLMYRTQCIFYLEPQYVDHGHALKEVERRINGEMICSHFSDGDGEGKGKGKGKVWDFRDPGRYAGVKRCGECATEWEVAVGDVFTSHTQPYQDSPSSTSSDSEEDKTRDGGDGILQLTPSGQLEEFKFDNEDTGKVAEKANERQEGLIIALTVWRDLGHCLHLSDPRWTAHSFTTPTPISRKDKNLARCSISTLAYLNNILASEIEAPQTWELGEIKTAFESRDVCGEGGCVRWELEELYSRRLKLLMGMRGMLLYRPGMEVVVRFL